MPTCILSRAYRAAVEIKKIGHIASAVGQLFSSTVATLYCRCHVCSPIASNHNMQKQLNMGLDFGSRG